MRSDRPRQSARLATLLACGLLAVAVLCGCATTQETAEKKQAESKRFLEQREAKRDKKAQSKKKGGDKP